MQLKRLSPLEDRGERKKARWKDTKWDKERFCTCFCENKGVADAVVAQRLDLFDWLHQNKKKQSRTGCFDFYRAFAESTSTRGQCKSENTSNMHWVIMHPLENSGHSPNGDGLHVLKRDSFYNLLVSVAYYSLGVPHSIVVWFVK